MANKRIEVDFIVNDKASSVFNKIRNNVSSMSSVLISSLNSSATAVNKFDYNLKKYNASMYRFNSVARGIFSDAARYVSNFTRDAIQNFSELERQHSKTMGAIATEYDKTSEAQAKFLSDSQKLKQQALTLGTLGPNGNGSLNSVTDVSYAQTALVKAGMSADDLLNSNAVSDILKFAGGNDLSIDTATTFAVNLATVFDKPVQEWGKMLDMVTKAADISVIDVEDIMNSLTYTGGIASGLGRSLEEVLGVISVMGQAGLRGRVAGTGLQAFFTRILSMGELSDTAIGNAPTEYAGNIYNAFLAETVNEDGTFKDINKVAETLDVVMDSLNDQEQAWFAKKLFGLYQMKAAYALTGAVDGDYNMITDFINQIENQSSGTNDIKYSLMLASQYGKLTSLSMAWEGTKTDLGSKLSPVVEVVADELLNFLKNNGNYKFNWDALRRAFAESGDLIGAKYGEAVGRAIDDIGNLGINAGMISNALIPEVGGIFNGIIQLLNGDVFGALETFKSGIEDTNDKIDDLPPELQLIAGAIRNAIVMFTSLSGINLAAQILQVITTAFNMFIAKPISWVTGKITSTNTSVTSTSSTITTGTINIGSVQLMNVNASVVNVYGGGGNNSPNNGYPGGSPLTPTGGGGSLLPWLTAGGGYAAGKALTGSGTKALPGATGTASSLLNNGSNAVNVYKVGGKYYTASQLAGSAARMLGVAGVLATTMTLGGDSVQKDVVYNNTLSKGAKEGYDNEALRQYLYDNFYGDKESKNWAVERYDAQIGMYSKWMTADGASETLNLIKEELEEQSTLSEQFLRELVTSENGKYIGNQNDLELLFSLLFSNEYNRPSIYGGSFANKYSTEFARNAIENNNILTESMNSINSMMDRIQNPIINVNVTTNVDKSGNSVSQVDINSISRGISRRSSQYGAIAMDK